MKFLCQDQLYSTVREVRGKQRKARKERGAGVRAGAEGAMCVCLCEENGSYMHSGGWQIYIVWGMEGSKGFRKIDLRVGDLHQ